MKEKRSEQTVRLFQPHELIALILVIVVLMTVAGFFVADNVIQKEALSSATSGRVVSKDDGKGECLSYIHIEVPYEFLGETKYTTKPIAVPDSVFDEVSIGDYYDSITGCVSNEDASEWFSFKSSILHIS